MEIKETKFKAIIKPNSRTNEIICFDKNKKAYLIKVKAKAENNKTNKELIKFLSKILGKSRMSKNSLTNPT
jgi:uncharacterized protein YggU (UPF0235/DUF167 family)